LRGSRSSSWSASTKGCTASISAPASASRNWSCRSPDAPVRARHAGEVVLQTHDPAHPLLRGLIERGYAAVARDLLAERRSAQMPPYAQMALLRGSADAR
jgi:hypothetical protein